MIRNSGEHSSIYMAKNGLELVAFSNLLQYDHMLVHCFTTRKGGVSTGECESLNLGFKRKDSRENVIENYRRVCSATGIDMNNLVLSDQVHEDRVFVVNEQDRGKGILVESDIAGYDALTTDSKNVALVTFYADCVPIFFLDPIRPAIALAHSGWRGTVKEIAARTVEKMEEQFGTHPGNIIAAIGPSIGECCFETGGEVAEAFLQLLPWSEPFCRQTSEEKWHINLQSIIKTTLIKAGLREDNICISGLCTKCRNDIFFSHRGDMGRTGSLAAFMQLI